MEGEKQKSQDEGNLEEETREGVEGIPAPEMATVVQAVEFFQPSRRARKQITDSGDIVGENRTGGSGKKLGEGVVEKERGVHQDEKKAKGQNLVGGRHGQDSLEPNFPIGGGGHPVADAGIAVRNGIEKKMAGHSCGKSGHRTAGEGVCQEHANGNVDGGKHGDQSEANSGKGKQDNFIHSP